MKKGKIIILIISLIVLVLGGCSSGENDNQIEKKSNEPDSVVSPRVELNEEYYRGVLPYKASSINGMLREIPTRLDNKYFELGLVDLAKTEYDPSQYIFQDGQVLTMNEIEPLLDKDQYPQFEKFLYTVTEHDYILENGYGGIVIGVIVSPQYSERSDQGKTVTTYYTDQELEDKSKELVNELLSIVRKKINTSIIFGVMKAETEDLKKPGTFILTGKVKEGENKVSDWTSIDEAYLFLPSSRINPKYSDITKMFSHFKDEMNTYLPGFFGITGLGHVKDGDLVELTLKVYTELDSTVETIQFTQFAVSRISKYFPENTHINLYVYSIDRPKAIYVRSSDGKDFMHIYKD